LWLIRVFAWCVTVVWFVLIICFQVTFRKIFQHFNTLNPETKPLPSPFGACRLCLRLLTVLPQESLNSEVSFLDMQ
jgi:hypothetical protein